MKKSGFTLVELMVVIVIIGILAALALPRFMDAQNKAKASELPPAVNSLLTAQAIYKGENSQFANCVWTDANLDHSNDLIEQLLGLRLSGNYFQFETVTAGVSFTANAEVYKGFGGVDIGTKAVVTEDLGFSYVGDPVSVTKLKKYCIFLK